MTFGFLTEKAKALRSGIYSESYFKLTECGGKAHSKLDHFYKFSTVNGFPLMSDGKRNWSVCVWVGGGCAGDGKEKKRKEG